MSTKHPPTQTPIPWKTHNKQPVCSSSNNLISNNTSPVIPIYNPNANQQKQHTSVYIYIDIPTKAVYNIKKPPPIYISLIRHLLSDPTYNRVSPVQERKEKRKKRTKRKNKRKERIKTILIIISNQYYPCHKHGKSIHQVCP